MATKSKITGLPDRSHIFTKPNYRQFVYVYDQEYHISAYEGDKRWIEQQLKAMPSGDMYQLTTGYTSTFREAWKAETNEAAKEGAARNRANNWLREQVDNYRRKSLY